MRSLPPAPQRHYPGPLPRGRAPRGRAVTSSRSRWPARPSPRSRSGSFDITVPITRTIQMFSMPDDWDARESSDGSAVRPSPMSWGTTSASPTSTPAPRIRRPRRTEIWPGLQTAGASWSMMSSEGQFPQPHRGREDDPRLGAGRPRAQTSASPRSVRSTRRSVLHASRPRRPARRPPLGRPRFASPTGVTTTSSTAASGRPPLKDQDVPVDRTVVGTDCVSDMEPSDRRNTPADPRRLRH